MSTIDPKYNHNTCSNVYQRSWPEQNLFIQPTVLYQQSEQSDPQSELSQDRKEAPQAIEVISHHVLSPSTLDHERNREWKKFAYLFGREFLKDEWKKFDYFVKDSTNKNSASISPPENFSTLVKHIFPIIKFCIEFFKTRIPMSKEKAVLTSVYTNEEKQKIANDEDNMELEENIEKTIYSWLCSMDNMTENDLNSVFLASEKTPKSKHIVKQKALKENAVQYWLDNHKEKPEIANDENNMELDDGMHTECYNFCSGQFSDSQTSVPTLQSGYTPQQKAFLNTILSYVKEKKAKVPEYLKKRITEFVGEKIGLPPEKNELPPAKRQCQYKICHEDASHAEITVSFMKRIPKTSGPCRKCGKTKTPQWRLGPSGPGTLCNACGLRYAQNRSKKRPISKTTP